jgi:hypothetical protein
VACQELASWGLNKTVGSWDIQTLFQGGIGHNFNFAVLLLFRQREWQLTVLPKR